MDKQFTNDQFCDAIKYYVGEVQRTSEPTHLKVQSLNDEKVKASINFVVPTKLPDYFYDTQKAVPKGDRALTREQFLEELPEVFHDAMSYEQLNEGMDIISEAMGGNERYIVCSRGGKFISSARLLALIVDEYGVENF